MTLQFFQSQRLQQQDLKRSYRSKEKLVNLIRYLGRLYDGDLEGIDEFRTFQDILDLVDSNKTTGIFNTKEKLELLAPKCADYVIKCKWAGEIVNCTDVIEFRRTNEGEFDVFLSLRHDKNCNFFNRLLLYFQLRASI